MNYYYSREDFDSMMHFLGQKLDEEMPFCVFRLPQRNDLTDKFVVIIPEFEDDTAHRVAAKVKPWLSSRWFDFSTTGNLPVAAMPVCPASTPKEQYIRSVSELIEILKKRGGKTVICRNICGHFGDFDLSEIFRSYLDTSIGKNCVTFLLWHPEMNFWMGSTPELILERLANGTYRTIALAGTRHHSIKSEWDPKNIEEHKIVVNDIENRLKLTGLDFLHSPMQELAYGPVTHLVTEFVSKFVDEGHDRLFFDSIAEEIEPTPALAGYPRARAISEIERFEAWPRYLYAGCLNIAEVRLIMTYGIIRCVHFDKEKWSVYTGSGVTPDSCAADEWEETRIKALPLLECLERI